MKAPETVDYSQLADKFRLRLVLLFGSRAQGPVRERSDVDIAVLAEDDLSPQNEWKLLGKLMELLQTDRIDLVVLNRSDYFLRYEATQNCKLLFESRPYLYQDYAWRAVQNYEAHKPLEKLRRELLHEKILDQPSSR